MTDREPQEGQENLWSKAKKRLSFLRGRERVREDVYRSAVVISSQSDTDDSLDLLNPLNPLSPISPVHHLLFDQPSAVVPDHSSRSLSQDQIQSPVSETSLTVSTPEPTYTPTPTPEITPTPTPTYDYSPTPSPTYDSSPAPTYDSSSSSYSSPSSDPASF